MTLIGLQSCSGGAFLLGFFQPDRLQQYARLVVELDHTAAHQPNRPEAAASEPLTDKLAVAQQERADHRAARPQFREGLCQQFRRCARVHDVALDAKITVTVIEVTGGQVRLGIEAPREIPVWREEVVVRETAAA